MKNPYEILEVDPSSTEEEIKKAYRKKAQETHPDKGGNTEIFQDVSRAYEILSDAEKREYFDKTGEEFRDDIREEVIGALVQIVMGAIQNNQPAYVDIIEIARKAVEQQQSRHGLTKTQLENQINSLKDTSSRIVVAEGKENILADAILSHTTGLEQQIDIIDNIIKIGEQILEMLQDYSYKKEVPPIWTPNNSPWAIPISWER